MRNYLVIVSCGMFLAGCEQLGIETPAKVAAAKEAEGRAIGGACRHSGRALEDCYNLNKRASKAAIFAGWRDMDAYMRENNIEIVPPAGGTAAAQSASPLASETPAEGSAAKGAPPAAKTAPPATDGKTT